MLLEPFTGQTGIKSVKRGVETYISSMVGLRSKPSLDDLSVYGWD